MEDEYDRDWIFIIRRLHNQFNFLEKQLCVLVNDTALFDASGKLSLIVTMNTKPYVTHIKQLENPSTHQMSKLFNGKMPTRFLDLPEELEDPATVLSTRVSSPVKRSETIDNSKVSLEGGADKKDLREQRERERNNWRIYQTRVGVSNLL